MAEETDLTNDAKEFENTNNVEPNEIADDPEKIRGQIEETRHEMSETINALEEKLSLDKISEQVSEKVSEKASEMYETAKDTVYDATVGRAEYFMKKAGKEISKSNIFNTARENPLALILIGAGIGLLAYEFSNRKNASARRFTDRRSFRYGKHTDSQSEESTLKTAQRKIGVAVGDTYESVSSAVGDAYENVSGAAGHAYETAGDFANQSYKKVGEYGSLAVDQYNRQIQENPLVVGAVALAVGAVVGFSIPSTRYEGELMGETKQNLVQKVQGAADDLIGKAKDVAKNVAGEAKQTISEEAKKQGLAQ